MAEEGFDDKRETSDPDEDYGLPKIEIKPLQKAESTQEKVPVVPSETTAPEAASPGRMEAELPRPSLNTDSEENGKSYGWLVMLLIFAAILVGGWFYYDYSFNGEGKAEKPESIIKETVPEPAPPLQEPVDEPVEEVETFSLTEIQSRADRPRYFLVVASFIDEDLAKDHAEKLHAGKMNTFLVYPYGEIAYYRLAIGQFESFALAAEEIAKVKDNFKENLWVLKY